MKNIAVTLLIFFKEHLFEILLSILLLITIFPLLKTGLPITHDGEGHIARAANYAAALRQGQFPPRWAPSFWNGYGYPVFNFYYPLLNILATPFILIGIHLEIVIKIWLAVGILLLVIAWILIGKVITNFKSGIIASFTILFSHYFFNLLYVRGAFGEFFAYVSVSWVFLFTLLSLSAKKQTSQFFYLIGIWISTFLLALSHNLMAVIFLPIIGIILTYLSFQKKIYFQILIVFLLGICLSSFFWFPVIFEKNLIIIDQTAIDITDHFDTLHQLLFDKVGQGLSQKGPKDGMSFGIGVFSLIIIVFTLIFLFNKLLKHKPIKPLIILILIALIGVFSFLTLEPSKFIWLMFPPFQILQFPWRLLGPIMLTTSLLSIFIWNYFNKWMKYGMIILIVILLIDRSSWPLREYYHYPKEYYNLYTQTSTVQDELRPKTWQMSNWMQSDQKPNVGDQATFQIDKWRGSYRKYTVTSFEPITVIEPTMYFAGWETSIDGKKVAIDPKLAKGQIAFQMPAGTHTIKTNFTQNTYPRIIGNTITFTSFILSLIYGYYLWKKQTS